MTDMTGHGYNVVNVVYMYVQCIGSTLDRTTMLVVVEVVTKLHIWWWVLGAKIYTVLQLLGAKVLRS